MSAPTVAARPRGAEEAAEPEHAASPLAPARGALAGLVGAVLNGGLGFLLTAVILGGFGAAGSGQLLTAIAVVTIVAALCCAGADTALLWSLPRRHGDGTGARLLPVALLPGLAVATAVAGGGVVAAEALAPVLFGGHTAHGAGLLRAAFVAVPVVVAMTVLLAAVRAVRPVRDYVAVQSAVLPLARLALVGIAGLTGGIGAAFTGWLVPAGLAVLLAAALLVRPLGLRSGVRLRPERAEWRTFWRFAVPRGASAAIDASSMWVGLILAAALAGPSAAGVFGAAGRYALAGLLVMHGLRVAVAPRLSRLLGAGLAAEAAGVYRQATMWTIVLSWPGYVLLAVFAPAFLGLFGDGFDAGAAPLVVLCAAMVVNSGVGVVQTLLLMSGHSGYHLVATLAGLASNVILCVALIPAYGALGAAVAWAVGITVENGIAALAARRVIGVPLLTAAVGRIAALAAGTATVAAAAGAVLLGRGVAGLAAALGVLIVGAGCALAHPRARTLLRARRPVDHGIR